MILNVANLNSFLNSDRGGFSTLQILQISNKITAACLPLLIGFMLDCLIGDPHSLPHPVRLIGKTISCLEKLMRKLLPKHEFFAGAILSCTVLFIFTLLPAAILFFCYSINLWLGIAAESVMCSYMLAARCLYDESMKVYYALASGDVEKARSAVSMIVGRDTASLTADGITKAAVETVAENTSDGITAPIFYMMLGGATLGFFYKSANTMDSMLGYKNEKYVRFGRFSAKLDDILNYIPSRMTAVLMIASANILGMNGKNACKIWKRDRLNHASPNSAQTESVCAGALGVMLAGDAYYFGQLVRKKTIGDDIRPIKPDDIQAANRLMYCTAFLMLIVAVLVRMLIYGVLL